MDTEKNSILHRIVILEEDHGMRLDIILAKKLPHLSRSRIQYLIKTGHVGSEYPSEKKVIQSKEKVCYGEIFSLQEAVLPAMEHVIAESIPLNILFEDDDIIVINKKSGMVVHRGPGHNTGTLVNALLYHFHELSVKLSTERSGIVHRLDKETSGCLVVAKNEYAQYSLSEQFSKRSIVKTYLAITHGNTPIQKNGIINYPIRRHPIYRQKMAIASPPNKGREALTEYKVIASENGYSLFLCYPKTGRTHQIRVHLSHRGYPIVNDELYGRKQKTGTHLLHAWKLEFMHPISKEIKKFVAPIPNEFLNFNTLLVHLDKNV